MRTQALHNRGTAEISPEEATVTNIEQAHEAIDAEYSVERTGADRFVVRNMTRQEVVYDGPYGIGQDIPGIAGFKVQLDGLPGDKFLEYRARGGIGQDIPGIAGFKVQLDGLPEIGDKFRVQTWGVGPLEYTVHEGMILYLIAQFIELALNKCLAVGDVQRTGNKIF